MLRHHVPCGLDTSTQLPQLHPSRVGRSIAAMDPGRVIALWADLVASPDDIRIAVAACDRNAEWVPEANGARRLAGMPPEFAITSSLSGPSRDELLALLPLERHAWPAHLSMAHRVGRADLRFFVASAAYILSVAPQITQRQHVAARFDGMCSAQWHLHGGTRAFNTVAGLVARCSLVVVAGTTETPTKPSPLVVDGWPMYMTGRDKAILALALLFTPQNGWSRATPPCAPRPIAEFAAWLRDISAPVGALDQLAT